MSAPKTESATEESASKLPAWLQTPDEDSYVPNAFDKQIYTVMKQLKELLRNVNKEANDASVSAERKAELDTWLKNCKIDVSEHILVSFNVYLFSLNTKRTNL